MSNSIKIRLATQLLKNIFDGIYYELITLQYKSSSEVLKDVLIISCFKNMHNNSAEKIFHYQYFEALLVYFDK